jgi:spermidine synthase
LVLYCNRLQLFTERALYSDGDRYSPAVAVVERLPTSLLAEPRVLILGGGLGSLVRVLCRRGCTSAQYTLVELDNVVLGWALEAFADGAAPKTEIVGGDAEAFMTENQRVFDLIFVDVFQGRTVPEFVTSSRFLGQCKHSLSPRGFFALNYIEEDEQRWQRARATLAELFPWHELVRSHDNRIFLSAAANSEG